MTRPLSDYLPKQICDLYEVHNFRNAAEVLATGCGSEFSELMDALQSFRLTIADIRKPGGNESDIPKRLSALLRDKGWKETRIKGDLLITKLVGGDTKKARKRKPAATQEEDDTDDDPLEEIKELERQGAHVERIVREAFLDGHKVDYVKNRVAFDLEWNSKDQTFDRDLYAFRAFHECNLIDVGVILTRGVDLNEVFDRLGPETDETGAVKRNKNGKVKLISAKYGASTTWMGKLLYRLNAGRHGACPVLALGITRRIISDWNDYETQLAAKA